MAQSRLEKIGTIFTRVTGLLRSGAMKAEDKPIWYDVYAAFPPTLEPRFDRPAPNIPLRKIFYEEDIVRAKYHKITKPATINLLDNSNKTDTQEFISIYNDLKAQGPLDEERILDTAKEILDERLQNRRSNKQIENEKLTETGGVSTNLVEDFQTNKKSTNPTVNVSEIFKD